MIGCAIARSTSGGTGVGPGAKRYFFSIGSSVSGKKKPGRSEEHTSELQSLRHLVCRLLLEKKKKKKTKKNKKIKKSKRNKKTIKKKKDDRLFNDDSIQIRTQDRNQNQ